MQVETTDRPKIGGPVLDDFKQGTIAWDEYARQFNSLLGEREIEKHLALADLDQACMLCSEPTLDHCHRCLVAEYLRDKLGSIEITLL